MMSDTRKKILVIGTGGTIASRNSNMGLVPAVDVTELLTLVPEVADLCEIHQVQVLNLDSTNIQPEHWLTLKECIRKQYDLYDGFLILHGTDTMAYTASALSYLIQKSPKPIVLTGSQLPMEAEETDAKRNIHDSICYLIKENACDVNIVFAGKVIPGGRARKVCSHSMEAFFCVGYDFDASKRIKDIQTLPLFYHALDTKVLIWKLIPGMNPNLLLKLAKEYNAVVIEGFGLGGLPDLGENDYFPILKTLTEQRKVVAVTTQVPLEGSDMSVYEVGRRYKQELPILEGGSMTPENMAVKLMWILGQTKEPDEVRKLFEQSINYDRV